MSGPEPPRSAVTDPRVYFAAERTLLAWVRTGLALIGLGFVVARFGIFLRAVAVQGGHPPETQLGASQWIGSALVVLGVVVNAAAAARHVRLVRGYNRGETARFRSVSAGVVLSAVLAALGLLLVGYLLRLA